MEKWFAAMTLLNLIRTVLDWVIRDEASRMLATRCVRQTLTGVLPRLPTHRASQIRAVAISVVARLLPPW